MASVYIAPEVADVLSLHPYLAERAFRERPIRTQIAEQAATLRRAHDAKDPRVGIQVMSWWPGAASHHLESVLAGSFSEADALLTVSREHGFPDWSTVDALDDTAPDSDFEHAVETMLNGDLDEFQTLIDGTPRLVAQRSRFGHGSTLLHYLGSNGVESHRQRVPLNAVELASVLIAAGADKASEAQMYGGGQTPFALASTSAHPDDAGIAEALERVLALD
ncbi:MAG: hypothetical protein AAGD13_02655 [Pseudomonadota bacterium]